MQVEADDLRNVQDMRLAATGDVDAQLRLAMETRRLVVEGLADEIVTTVEGMTYARLAAAQGSPPALMVLCEHCAHLAKVYAECGERACSEDWHGHALAMLELATELLPDNEAAALMDRLTLAADDASPAVMAAAKQYRAIFAPAFGAEAFA